MILGMVLYGVVAVRWQEMVPDGTDLLVMLERRSGLAIDVDHCCWLSTQLLGRMEDGAALRYGLAEVLDCCIGEEGTMAEGSAVKQR